VSLGPKLFCVMSHQRSWVTYDGGVEATSIYTVYIGFLGLEEEGGQWIVVYAMTSEGCCVA